MKVYKKYDTYKNKQYNLLAKKYIEKNNIKCQYYAFLGMSGDKDLIKIDGKIFYFDIVTQELLRREALIDYSITDY
jgi:hypothetical protein